MAPLRISPKLELEPGTVDVWRVAAILPAEAWAPWLSAEEAQALGRFHFSADARREAASRGARRRLLGAYLAVDPLALRFATGEHGKPRLAMPGGDPALEFSASHSGDWALIAIAAAGRIGVDIEQWREIADRDRIVERFFTAPERTDLARWPAARRQEAFFRAWTLKEAYGKGVGTGLSQGLDSFCVKLGPDDAPEMADASRAGGPAPWRLWTFLPAPGYSGALAAEAPLAAYRLREFTAAFTGFGGS